MKNESGLETADRWFIEESKHLVKHTEGGFLLTGSETI